MLGPQCVLCGTASPHRYFCPGCEASLPRLPQGRCNVCANPLTSGETCGACLARKPAFDRVCAPYAYAFPVDALIHSFKYRASLTLTSVLARAMLEVAPQQIDAIVPMPLAATRLRERGFNQAQELARLLARECGVPMRHDACRRVSDTAPQAALPWRERARNIRRAFVSDADLSGLRIAIVDDVITTGATLNELAGNLKRAGAIHVSAWVVARTFRNQPF